MVTGLKNSPPLSVPVPDIGPRGSINWAYQLQFGQPSPVNFVNVVTPPTTPYTVMPAVVFTGGGGAGAAATAYLHEYFIGGGGHYFVFQVMMTNPGSGYTSPPAVSFVGGDGAGAVAIASLTPGFLAYSPMRFPSVIVPIGCSVVLRGVNGSTINAADVFIGEYAEQLTQPGRIILSPDTEISYQVDNLGSIYVAGQGVDGIIATVRGAAIG
jgi:hypothetical protein